MTYQPFFNRLDTPIEKGAVAVDPAEAKRSQGLYRRMGKRLFDLVLVAVMAVPVGAMVVLLALVVMTDGRNPFYGHERVGRNGRTFRCWKLRSMRRDSAEFLAAHLAADPAAAREWAETRKLVRDPRVTRVGKFIRKTSLDELPQLWNVLRGDMSLVGPRPVTAEEVDRYGTARSAYLSVRPGITGLWQVRGRNRLSYDRRIALDAEYARGCTFAMDLKILVATVPAVLRLTGN